MGRREDAPLDVDRPGFLAGVRVVELCDELGEYAGKVLAGLGAAVVKVEPPDGEVTRGYGPFLDDRAGPDRSLYFWHFNYGKRSVVADLDTAAGQQRFRDLVANCDVLLDSRPRTYLRSRGLGQADLSALNEALIQVRISAFGDDGPWADYAGSDLVHLALGGVMMNCGYDPDPSGYYDTPPIAPQMWQAYQIAGELTVIAIIGALVRRLSTGCGQRLSTTVHQAVAQATESDVPNWIYRKAAHRRVTCRHSRPDPDPGSAISLTKDGRWLLPYRTYLGHRANKPGQPGDTSDHDKIVSILRRHGMQGDLVPVAELSDDRAASTAFHEYLSDVVDRYVRSRLFEDDIWLEFQEQGLTWAPLRRPEENLDDPHWRARQTFLRVDHPELERTFDEVGAKWHCPGVPWRQNNRAPLLGEHTDLVDGESPTPIRPGAYPSSSSDSTSEAGFPLEGVRHIDLGWLLASGGAGRFLGALGAEVIKVEHETRPDVIRWGNAMVPEEHPEAASSFAGFPGSPNRSGFFMDINAGKRAISLNVKHPRGRELLLELIRDADVVTEGFSPGTMERLDLGYEALRKVNPGIVYVQQSGFGQVGRYGRLRSYGPVAQAFSGLSEMSGLPEPYPPAGIGYSYLDWFGAYNMTLAVLAGLYRRRITDEGCWIDSSQIEAGIYLSGTAVLDNSANGRRWRRSGNRSPYKPAAPHGAYRTIGTDRWIALACFTDRQWRAFVAVVGEPAWSASSRFATLADRLVHQHELDALVQVVTETWDGYELMDALQGAGVPAGVCQTARDRVERDPALAHLDWLTALPQSELGTWPVKEFPVAFDSSTVRIGGPLGRHGPCYGEDNTYVFEKRLGLSSREVAQLHGQGVI